MAKSFLDAWLDATLGEVPQESGDKLAGLGPLRGLDTKASALHGGIERHSNLGNSQQVFLDQNIQESGNNGTRSDG
ncbi:MAG TPA: hypothetical protein VFC54_10225 [Pseudolabrys sp.]|nr:hypothetical protein [Pseudolabrys sp.]